MALVNARLAHRWTAFHALALVLLLVLPPVGVCLRSGFDGLYGQDAYAYFEYATGSVRQSILHGAPLEPFFWPPGYPLLVALASLVLGPTPLAGQAVSLAMGGLVPLFTALLMLEIWPADLPAALLAGALVALSGQLWQSSIVVMADTTGLALATLAAWALGRYARRGRLAWLLLAAAAIAYATLSRWIYGLVGLSWAAYALWALFISPRQEPAAVRGHRRALWHASLALGLAAVLLVPVVGPSLIGLLRHPADPATFAGNFQVYSWSPVNVFRRDFFTADGHLTYAQPNGLYYALAAGNLAFFGPLLAPLVLLGWVVAVRTWERPTLALIAGWAGIVYAFHAGAPWQNFRFTLAYLPPLAMVVAGGLSWAWRRLERCTAARSLIGLWTVLGLLSMGVGGLRLVQGFVERKADDLALVQWVEAQTAEAPPRVLAPEASVRLLSFGPTLTFRHYAPSHPTIDLYDITTADLADLLAAPAVTYVLVDEGNVEQQWLGQAPYANFHWLADGPGLIRLGDRNGYTLFQVKRA